MNGTADETKDAHGRPIHEGDEVEIVSDLAFTEYHWSRGEERRFTVQAIDADDTVQGSNGYWLPGRYVARVADVTLPEPRPAILPPNPKAAFGAQKPDLSLVPGVAIAHEAMAMENGAGKYGPYNWRETAVEARTYVSAAKRHLDAWLDGQECSDDTSPPVHNLGHARACLAIILDAQACGNLIDNRPKPGKSADVQNAMKAAKLAAARSAFGSGA